MSFIVIIQVRCRRREMKNQATLHTHTHTTLLRWFDIPMEKQLYQKVFHLLVLADLREKRLTPCHGGWQTKSWSPHSTSACQLLGIPIPGLPYSWPSLWRYQLSKREGSKMLPGNSAAGPLTIVWGPLPTLAAHPYPKPWELTKVYSFFPRASSFPSLAQWLPMVVDSIDSEV